MLKPPHIATTSVLSMHVPAESSVNSPISTEHQILSIIKGELKLNSKIPVESLMYVDKNSSSRKSHRDPFTK